MRDPAVGAEWRGELEVGSIQGLSVSPTIEAVHQTVPSC